MVKVVRLLNATGPLPQIRRGGEMADALASGASDRKVMRVQVPPAAPKKLDARNRVFFISSFSC